MKISCCWLYAIELYGYPPGFEDTCKALKRMAELGFKYVEVEAFGTEGNIGTMRKNRAKIKEIADGLGIKVINFPIILPGLVSLNKKDREKGMVLFQQALEVAE